MSLQDDFRIAKEKAFKKYQKDREEFISRRSRIEQDVDNFFIELLSLPDNVKEGLNIPENTTARTLLPSLFNETFDPIKYKEEKDSLDEYINYIRNISDNKYREGVALYTAYLGGEACGQ